MEHEAHTQRSPEITFDKKGHSEALGFHHFHSVAVPFTTS
jgi:hypothetical protein